MPQLPVETRYLQSPISASCFMPYETLNVVESKRIHHYLYFFLLNMKFKKLFPKERNVFFLVWIRRKEKRKILKLYKVRFSET